MSTINCVEYEVVEAYHNLAKLRLRYIAKLDLLHSNGLARGPIQSTFRTRRAPLAPA